MTLARAWSRRIYGVSFVALLVPGAVLGSLAVLALAGSLGRIGAFGQVFSGPAAPSPVAAFGNPHVGSVGRTRTSAASVAPSGAGVRAAVAPARGRTPAATPGRGPAGRVNRPSGASGPTAGTGPTGGSGGGTGASGGGGGSRGGGGSGTGRLPGPPAPQPTPRPTPRPTLTDRVVGTAKSVTSRIPGAAGQVATGAVNTVGSVADKLLPGNGTGAQAASGSGLSGLP